ncbi:hypothetical protein ACFW0P_15770 [Lysobacter soli]|uniref:hypothetical protein n=1 Tax=Lysobacter soli TaxID=453783 RepID=UPI0036D1457F
MFVLSYTVAFLGSKFVGLSSGYALDDYSVVSGDNPHGLAAFFLSQGRYTNAALDVLLRASDLNMTNFSVLALFASLIFSALFYVSTFTPRPTQRPALVVAAAALLGAHSYYTEYVTFRQSALPMSVMFAMLWIGVKQYRIAVLDGNKPVPRLLGALAAGIVAMGANQLALCFAAIAVLYVHLAESASQTPYARLRSMMRALALTAAAGATLAAGNLLVAGAARSMADVPKDPRAALISASKLQERSQQLAEFMPKLLFQAEPIASAPAKILALLSVLLLLVPLSRRQLPDTCVALVFAVAALAIALLPHMLSGTWWPVPRTLIAIPMVFAGIISLLSDRDRWRAGVSAGLAIGAAVLFCAHSNAVLLNQQRVNRWDVAQAQAIANRAAEHFPDNKGKFAIVGGSWAYAVAPRAAQGDMNVSALSVGWAIDPLFDEATGMNLQVRAAPDLAEACAGRRPFPSDDGMLAHGDEIIVCL